MSALDACEPQIIRVFQKDGWTVTNKPFMIRTNERTVLADVSMQRRTNGQIEQIVILEVKCFTIPQNDLPEFYTAVGQYEFYRAALLTNRLMIPLYLALPANAYERLRKDSAVKVLIEQASLSLVTVDLEK